MIERNTYEEIDAKRYLTRRQFVAKIIRTVSIPPVMIFSLVIILANTRNDIFMNSLDAVISLLCLAIVPVFAYPLQKFIPALKDKSREGQRNLALALSMLGYLTAWSYGTIAKSNVNLMLIYGTYLMSVIILIIFNKVFRLRASGHACSVSGPIIFLCYYLGFMSAIICILLYGVILWASLELKRHTFKDYIMGTLTCIIAFILNLVIYKVF